MSSRFLIGSPVCGMPHDMRVSMRGMPGTKYCPECAKIGDKAKSCLSCGSTFQVGCRNKFVCGSCSRNNRETADDFEFVQSV